MGKSQGQVLHGLSQGDRHEAQLARPSVVYADKYGNKY